MAKRSKWNFHSLAIRAALIFLAFFLVGSNLERAEEIVGTFYHYACIAYDNLDYISLARNARTIYDHGGNVRKGVPMDEKAFHRDLTPGQEPTDKEARKENATPTQVKIPSPPRGTEFPQVIEEVGGVRKSLPDSPPEEGLAIPKNDPRNLVIPGEEVKFVGSSGENVYIATLPEGHENYWTDSKQLKFYRIGSEGNPVFVQHLFCSFVKGGLPNKRGEYRKYFERVQRVGVFFDDDISAFLYPIVR